MTERIQDNPDLKQIIADRLSSLRKDRELRQKDVADVIGTSANTYSVYETTKNWISVESLVKLSMFFEVSADYILGLSNCKHRADRYTSQKTAIQPWSIEYGFHSLIGNKNRGLIGYPTNNEKDTAKNKTFGISSDEFLKTYTGDYISEMRMRYENLEYQEKEQFVAKFLSNTQVNAEAVITHLLNIVLNDSYTGGLIADDIFNGKLDIAYLPLLKGILDDVTGGNSKTEEDVVEMPEAIDEQNV